jgi:hypothetical protein
MKTVDPSLILTQGASDGDVLTYVSANARIEFSSSTGGAGVTVYDNSNELPTSNVTIGSRAYVKSTNRFYLWNSSWKMIRLVPQ